MAKKSLVLAIAQVKQTSDIGGNLREIGQFAALAARAKADLVCFPECALTGYGPILHESPAGFDADAVAAGVDDVRGLAREFKISVVLGTHLPLDGGWTNSLLLIRSDGRIVAQYDKAHLYGWDAEFYRAGRTAAAPVTLKGVRVGLQICFDIRFPEPFRALALGGAKLIVVPSYIHGKKDMWKDPVITGHVASRAAENGRFIAFANAAGRTQNVPSMVATPRGEVLARCRRGAEQLLVAELDLNDVSDEYLMCRRGDLY